MTRLVAVLGLGASVSAQQVGTLKDNYLLPMELAKCTKAGGCTQETASVTMDANWRWLHEKSGFENCYKGSDWTCGSGAECASKCAVEGVAEKDWEETYGISRREGGVRVNFKTGDNVGSRFYMLDATDNYKQFQLLNRELTFDVDVSTLPCGMNGAVYFSEMAADGGMGDGNEAGAKYGTGYCDAQCPSDVKFISGEANSDGWNPGTARGKYGACCSEMDIWEANNAATAFTAHPCSVDKPYRCEGPECKTICDMPGCDLNSYRMGDHDFYGPGPGHAVDTLKPFTIVTQFIITTDGTDAGDLAEVRRYYVQDGKTIENSKATIHGLANQSVLSDEMCALDKKVFGEENTLAKFGGMAQMGKAIGRGMTLVLSLWDDGASKMNWLDAKDPADADSSKPGAIRGPCSNSAGDPSTVRSKYADSFVEYYNFKYGEIGSTVTGASPAPVHQKPAPAPAPAPAPEPELPPTPPSAPASGSCCYGGCGGSCKGPENWCSKSKSHCEASCNGQWCAKGGALAQVRRHRQLRGKDHAMAQKLFRLGRGKSKVHKSVAGTEEL